LGAIKHKYLIVSAAALLGSVAPAAAENQATAHSIHFFSQLGGSYCDGLRWQKVDFGFPGDVQFGTHLNNDCNGGQNPINKRGGASGTTRVT